MWIVNSRCTGYRPIADGFRPFASVPAKAYTQGASINGHSAEKAAPGVVKLDNGHAESATQVLVPGSEQQLCMVCGKRQQASGILCQAAHCLSLFRCLQICPASGLPCNCSKAEANGHGASANGKAPAGGAEKAPVREPLFPAELRQHQPQELRLQGACTWLRCTLGPRCRGRVAHLCTSASASWHSRMLHC